jgi:hypothetical protein
MITAARPRRHWAVKEAQHAIAQSSVVDDDTLSSIMAQTPENAAEGLAALFGDMSHWSDADFATRAEFVRHVAANAELLLADIADRLGPPSE